MLPIAMGTRPWPPAAEPLDLEGGRERVRPADLRIAVLGLGMMGAFHVDALTTRSGGSVTVVNDFVRRRPRVGGPGGARVRRPDRGHQGPRGRRGADRDARAPPRGPGDACLDAGKPVLCEKPLTTDVASAYAIVQKEAALGRPLIQVGFMRRFDPEYVALKDLITSGGLGNPLIAALHPPQPGRPGPLRLRVHDPRLGRARGRRRPLPAGRGDHAASRCSRASATSAAPAGTNDPMLVVFETASGRLVTDEIYVRSGVAYEVRTEVVGERGTP